MSHHHSLPLLFYTVLCVCIAGTQCSLLFLPQPPLLSPTPHSDLSTHTALLNVIIGAFSSPTEEIRAAASYALVSVSAGNLQLYLPVILQEIEAKPRRWYLLLHSLKEVREGGEGGGGGSDGREGREGERELMQYDPSMRWGPRYCSVTWQTLHCTPSSFSVCPKVLACHYDSPEGLEALKHLCVPQIWPFESLEAGTRNVVAKCVGKLTLLDPDTLLLPRLKVRG